MNCLGKLAVQRKVTSFRVESREFKRLKWDNLRDRNSTVESGLESG